MELVREARAYIDKKGKQVEIMAASIRNTEQLKQVALAGADGVAVPYRLLESAIGCELTDKSIMGFVADWKKTE